MSLDVALYGDSLRKYDEETEEYHTVPNVLFEYNITHNLNRMAKVAGVYKALWRPEELQITKASELLPHLRKGKAELVNNKSKYMAYNPTNGWGSYEGLINFITEYLEACERHPDADVQASR